MRIVALCPLLALLFLTACQDHPPVSAPVASPAMAETAAAPAHPHASSGPVASPAVHPEAQHKIVLDTTPVDTRILDVQTSDNGDGKRLTGVMTDHFKPSDGVFLSIRTKGTAERYTLSAKWLTPTGQTLTEYAQVISNPGQIDTVFSLSKPDSWPTGKYNVALSINGKLLRTVPFTVQ